MLDKFFLVYKKNPEISSSYVQETCLLKLRHLSEMSCHMIVCYIIYTMDVETYFIGPYFAAYCLENKPSEQGFSRVHGSNTLPEFIVV